MPLSLEDLERVESVGERQACLKAASCTSTAGDSPRALGSSHDCGEAHYLPLPPKLYLSPSTRSTLFRPFSSAARSTGPNHQVKNTPMQNEVEGRRQSKRRRAATCIGQVSSVLPPGRLPARGVAIEKEIQTVLNGTHRELVQATRKAEARRAAAVAAAEKWRNECIASIEHEFNSAMKQARHQFEEDQRLAQERLIDETKRKKRRVMDMQALERRHFNTADNVTKPSQRSSAFALRSSRSTGEVAPFKAASFRCRLNASEIRADIQAMERPFKEHPHKQSSPPTIRYNNGVLLFRRLRFRVGDSIVIEEKDGENDPIVWFLKTISDVEVILTDDNGSSRSIFLAELRAGRYQLKRASARNSEGERDSSPAGSSRS